MIPLILMLGFFGLFSSEEKKQQELEIEHDCYYIQNFYFRENDFLLIDRDKDSKISYAEAKVYRLGLFIETDTNKNGKILFDEFEKSMFRLGMRAECQKKKIKKNYSKKLLLEYQKMDLDQDTVIIPSEFEQYGSYSFDFIDINDDNYVDVKELKDFNQSLN
ncbi:MAG: hypothetical protein MK033_00810 [Candidatus Caenarcaniphilales bacterium]|nr:hypothetical protein [Candidatus Caenarcaniphilales bacterium]